MRLLLRVVVVGLMSSVTTVPLQALAADAILVWAQRNPDATFSINMTAREKQNQVRRLTLSNNTQPEAAPVVISDERGNIWVAWTRLAGMSGTIHSRFFSGADGQWRTEEVVKTATSSDLAPSLGIDDAGTVWLAFSGSGRFGDDIYICRWNGSAWDVPFQVNRENTTPDILPVFAVDAKRRLVLFWKGLRQGGYRTLRSVLVRGVWSKEELIPLAEKQRMMNTQAQKNEGGHADPLLAPPFVPPDQSAIWRGNKQQQVSIRIQRSSP